MDNNNTDPTLAPPLEERGIATANLSAGAPLPSRGGAGVGSVFFIYRRHLRLSIDSKRVANNLK